MQPLAPDTELSVTLTAQELSNVIHVLLEAVCLPPRIQVPLAQKIIQSAQVAAAHRGNGVDEKVQAAAQAAPAHHARTHREHP